MTTTTPYVNFDSVAQDYDRTRGIPAHVQIRISERMRDAAKWRPGEVFLDAGAGTGRFSVPLARLGVPVIGVEISATMLARMRVNREAACLEETTDLPLRAVQGDLRCIPVASRAFKAVVIVHILHLITDWRVVLDEVQRVLQPGGMLLMGKQGGKASPARTFYNGLAKERGLLTPILGAYEEEVRSYLAGQGGRIAEVDMSDITWTARHPLSLTLEMLRRRTWASLRQISDADNAALLAETAAWALKRYGSLDVVEEDEGACTLTTAYWP